MIRVTEYTMEQGPRTQRRPGSIRTTSSQRATSSLTARRSQPATSGPATTRPQPATSAAATTSTHPTTSTRAATPTSGRRRPAWRMAFARLGMLLAALVLVACDSDEGPIPVATVSLSPLQATLLVGDTVTLTATARGPDGAVVDGMPVTWSTRHPELVTVSGTSVTTRVVGLRAGIAEINGAVYGRTGVASIEVRNRVPEVVLLSPAAAAAGAPGLTLTVTGTGFAADAQVTWNGAARPTQYVNATQLQATIPAADLATTGTAAVTVINPLPGGGPAPVLSFAIVAAQVAAVEITPSPLTVAAGATATLQATPKDGFGNVVAADVVWASSQPAVSTVAAATNDATPRTAVVSGVAGGASVISATAGGITAYVPVTVTQVLPTITAITPDSAESSPQGLQITIRGTGFVPNTGAFLNSSSRPTEYVSATEVRMTLWAGDLGTSGTRQIHVFNPGQGGGMSAGQPFRIVPGVWSVTISPQAVSLWPGQETTLTATAFDEANRPVHGRTATWSSSHPAIATVDAAGRVRAVASGVATINVEIGGRTAYRAVVVHTPLPWDLLYEGTHGGGSELWLLTLGPDMAPRRVLPAGTYAANPAASPDGARIAFVGLAGGGERKLFIVNRDGTGLRQLTTGSAADDQPAWSRDGTRIAFRRQGDVATDIFVINADGTGLVNVTNNAAREGPRMGSEWPSWTPAGRLVFSHGAALLNPRPFRLVSTRPDGSDWHNLTSGDTIDTEAEVSPTGTRIALRRAMHNSVTIDVIAGDGTGLAWINHPGPGSTPSWSPDGQWLTFSVSDGIGQSRISVMSVSSMAGGLGERLTAVPSGGRNPVWIRRN